MRLGFGYDKDLNVSAEVANRPDCQPLLARDRMCGIVAECA